MLMLLTGPSGGGKTTTIRAGRTLCDWLVIETFTTRPARCDFDSKTQIDEAEWENFQSNPDNYLVINYCDYLYINRLSDLRHAAQEAVSDTYVVDWVHKYPTPLQDFGPHAVGIILCPELEELRVRLKRAGRLSRLESSISDYWKIQRTAAAYPFDWKIINNAENPRSVATHISQLVSDMFTC